MIPLPLTATLECLDNVPCFCCFVLEHNSIEGGNKECLVSAPLFQSITALTEEVKSIETLSARGFSLTIEQSLSTSTLEYKGTRQKVCGT